MIHFDIVKQEEELKELESKTYEPNFWNDSKKSSIVLEKMKRIKNKCLKYRNLENEINNLTEFADLIKTEYDEDLAKEMEKNLKDFEKSLEKFEIENLLSGKFDQNNAILTIHPGAGRNRGWGLG